MASLSRDECYAFDLAARMGSGSTGMHVAVIRGTAHRDQLEMLYASPLQQLRQPLAEANTGLRETFSTPLRSSARARSQLAST